jgi:branched-chain amino acid aminotransferase
VDIYYCDGVFVPASEARIPVDDLALLRGFGVFEFLRTYNGKPFCLDEHLARLERSARLISLALPMGIGEIKALVHRTLEKNAHPESNIRIVVTGGSSPDFITPTGNSRRVVMVTRLMEHPAWWVEKGVEIVTVRVPRFMPEAKSVAYVQAVVALGNAKAGGAVEAVYVDQEGQVFEGTTSNLFIVKNGALASPETGVLAGVTRGEVLKLLKDIAPATLRSVRMEELMEADEAFLTATNKEIAPVVRVDGQAIGEGRPGPVTRLVMAAFARHVGKNGAETR